jgi:hypothetical protein
MMLPVPADVPLQEPVNHCATAAVPANPPLRESVVEALSQMVLVPVIAVGANDKVLTVTVTDAQLVVLQVPL